MMAQNISSPFNDVNKHAVLTSLAMRNKFAVMRYGERLKAARGEMTQAKLAELTKVPQSTISQLENSKTAIGSQYTPRFARATGVSVDWLGDEIGDMMPDTYSTRDPKIAAIARMLEQERAPYLVEKIQKDLTADIELMRAATERAKGNGES